MNDRILRAGWITLLVVVTWMGGSLVGVMRGRAQQKKWDALSCKPEIDSAFQDGIKFGKATVPTKGDEYWKGFGDGTQSEYDFIMGAIHKSDQKCSNDKPTCTVVLGAGSGTSSMTLAPSKPKKESKRRTQEDSTLHCEGCVKFPPIPDFEIEGRGPIPLCNSTLSDSATECTIVAEGKWIVVPRTWVQPLPEKELAGCKNTELLLDAKCWTLAVSEEYLDLSGSSGKISTRTLPPGVLYQGEKGECPKGYIPNNWASTTFVYAYCYPPKAFSGDLGDLQMPSPVNGTPQP